MTISTSYFYHVRNLWPNQIPVSTAVWDPKWFHNFKGQDEIFFDKRGVINGVRAEFFAPDETCRDLCMGRERCFADPSSCAFLMRYSKQLDGLDFTKVVRAFNNIAEGMCGIFRDNGICIQSADIEFVLLFHETPDNVCSERGVVQTWFARNGMTITELFH